ncbi:DUF6515 family protein [Cyanobacterium aponinum UTEX 3222]|uniref:DUF6515 family protein n=1 Tax=Cyanobacterium aponinum TaxID=379064 RepID=UPI00308E13DA|nr:DUF6515 family protein [Cyanobacterium aponinum UTEX 3222]
MKLINKPFIFIITVLLTILTILSDVAYAGRGGGRGGGGRSGGGARTSSVQRSSSSRSSRGGGASPRVSSGTSLQNRGNLSNSSSRQSSRQSSRSNAQSNRNDVRSDRQSTRQTNQGDRQSNRSDAQSNRQDNAANRQDDRSQNQGNRQENRTDRQGNRQDGMTNRQNNRQDFVNDNWYGGGWYGGGYYTPPGWGAWAGLAGLTTGLIIGATVNETPPYYDTVYIGSSSYIYSDGVYMQPVNDNYIVVAPPTGVVVNYLPDGCTLIQDGDFQYYDCAGIYYEAVYQDGATVYRVIEY